MDLENQYEYAVVAIKQAVEKSRYRAANRQSMANDLDVNGEGLLIAIRQPMAGDIDWSEFISLGFTHHMEILSKTKEISERLFYIHECAARAWGKYTLREYIKSGLYQKKGNLPNNFTDVLNDTWHCKIRNRFYFYRKSI